LTFAVQHAAQISNCASDQGLPAMTVPIVSLIAYIAIAVAAIASLPVWPWSRTWGNGNAGALAYVLLVVSINAGVGQII
jgi:Protein of unknown function (DUF3309)